MMIWGVIAVLTILNGLWMAWPFLRSRSMEMSGAEGAISIYRDQLDEIDRDCQEGLISEAEADAARQEVERRALYAARTLDSGIANSHRSVGGAVALVAVSAICAVGLYAFLGHPQEEDRPLASRKTEILTRNANAGDINARIQLLIARTQENPKSQDNWIKLAETYTAVEDHASAIDAYRKAADLSDNAPRILSAMAESMTLANGNKVPPAARVIFEQLMGETGDARAWYYAGLVRAQSQDYQGAIEIWATLASASEPNAPWMPTVRSDIVNMARVLEDDVRKYLPNATPTEIAASGGQAAVELTNLSDRIATLEQGVAGNPKDYKAWIDLAEVKYQSGDTTGATEAMAEAKTHFAGAPFVLQKFAESERALGLTVLGDTGRGPTADDIAAASDMSQEERDDMIDGMVAGLAARLEEQPNDPDGWVMLIRSYATLGQTDKARKALDQAHKTFEHDATILLDLNSSAADLAL